MVALGRGVKVAVGGNQTMVAVGVSVGGKEVEVGRGGKGVETGKQALSPALRKMIIRNNPERNISLVYYEMLPCKDCKLSKTCSISQVDVQLIVSLKAVLKPG
jgi:hypothetical protein